MFDESTPRTDAFDPPRKPRRILRWRDLGRSRKRESKVKPLQVFASELACREVRTRRLVHCHGVFDLLHIGHIRHLQEARRLGDHLVVTLTPDAFVNKGPHRPAFDAETRAEALAALECVDTVCINEWPTAVETIRLLRPVVFMKGMVAGEGPRDRNGAIEQERDAVAEVGGRLVLTDTELHSASALINRHTDVFDANTRGFLAALREQTSADEIVEALGAMRENEVRVSGSSDVQRVFEILSDRTREFVAGQSGRCQLAVVAGRDALLLEPAERRALRLAAQTLVVDLAGADAVAVDGWQDVSPDLLICDEPLGSSVAPWFERSIAVRPNGALVVRDRASGVRVEAPALPVNPVNRVDERGSRAALVAFAAAACALGMSPQQIGFLGNVASSAAKTVAAGAPPDLTSICRQIDSLLE